MTDYSLTLQSLAAKFGRPEPPRDGVREALSSISFVAAGFGSIARPFFEELAVQGARRITIVDPKSYFKRSVHSQCELDEVGQPKVSVGATRLRALGADVRAFACDLYEAPDGISGPDTIMISSVDNRRGDIGANRMAARTGARLVKINIEPDECTVAVRAYDFRSSTSLCAECQFGERHYENQRHPRSCDGPGEGRPTNSPRWLSQSAAQLGFLVATDLALDDEAARHWLDCEWQYRADQQRVEQSLLTTSENCRWDHRRRWQNVERLTHGPASISLRDVLGADPCDLRSGARIRFCQSVSLGGACRDCGRPVRLVRWTRDSSPDAAIDICGHCGGAIASQGYWKFSEVAPGHLAAVWEKPLADWGVEPFAVVALRADGRERTFVVGEDIALRQTGGETCHASGK